MHYSKETPSCSTFRVITTNVLGVRIFRKFTVLIFNHHCDNHRVWLVRLAKNIPVPVSLNLFYLKNRKYSNTRKICCNHPKIWTMWLYHWVVLAEDVDGIAKNVGPDQTAPGHAPTLFARSFRRRFFAYHYAVNHPHTNIILSWFSILLVLKCAAKILKIGLQIKI